MISAADLQALHQQKQQQQGSANAAPALDPFPSLGGAGGGDDPFPAPSSSVNDPFPATIGSSLASVPKAKAPAGTNGSSQPDL